MTVVGVAFIVVLAVFLAVSVRRPAIGAAGFIALTPLYYVARGMGGQSALMFLWPYIYMAAYGHVIAVRAMAREYGRPGPQRRWSAPWGFLWAGYIALAIALIWWSRWIAMIVSAPVLDTLREFNDHRVVIVGGLLVALTGGPVIAVAVRSRLRHVTWLDWSVLAILAYGLLHVAVGFFHTGHTFFVLESFRYYFVMVASYFVVRHSVDGAEDVRLIISTIICMTCVAALEFITEHYLFNSGVSSLSLPWLSAFETIFDGYGRPMPIDGWYVMTRQTDAFFIPYAGVRGIGLFIHPHTLGLFAAMGMAWLIPVVLDVRRKPFGMLLIAGLLYAQILTLARFPFLLGIALLIALPVATWYVVPDRFAWRRVPVYVCLMVATVYVGSNYSPGGQIPHSVLGWYTRPVMMTGRAIVGDLRQHVFPRSATQTAAIPTYVVTTPAKTVDQPEAPAFTAIEAPVTEAVTEAKALTNPASRAGGEVLRLMRNAVGIIGQAPIATIVFGRGFSPLTKYVVDYFPEASQYRHMQSTSDLVYLEYFLQFGAVGLLLLLTNFAVFGAASVRIVRYARDQHEAIGLSAAATIVVTAVALLHLYPLFRIGVNTMFYGVLGIVGALAAGMFATASPVRTTPGVAPSTAAHELA